MTFEFNVDFWIFPGMPMLEGILFFAATFSSSGAVVGVFAGVFVFLITLLIFRLIGFPCAYTFTEDALLVRYGAMRAHSICEHRERAFDKDDMLGACVIA